MAKFSDDLENWMSKLPNQLRDEAIINLAIPGSHDSATYGISRSSKLAPDAEKIVREIFPFIPCIIRKWSKTQKYSLKGQLDNGVRFFDLRVAWNSRNEKIYFVHGLYCEEITQSFDELFVFLQEHPSEFVILDFQHFYDFQAIHHQLLISHLMKFFHTMIVDSRSHHLSHLTLNRALQYSKQLLITYRSCHSSPIFFTSRDFPTPWANTTKVEYLKEFLTEELQKRHENQGWILQCIITPDANYIIRKFYSSLKKTCAKKVLKEMEEWIMSQTPGKWSKGENPRVNIILGDFVEMDDNRFCKMVIDLNMKLL